MNAKNPNEAASTSPQRHSPATIDAQQTEPKAPESQCYFLSCLTKVLVDPASFEQPIDANNRKALQQAYTQLATSTPKLSFLHYQAFDRREHLLSTTNYYRPPVKTMSGLLQSQMLGVPSQQPGMPLSTEARAKLKMNSVVDFTPALP